jgi:hypothetical protein
MSAKSEDYTAERVAHRKDGLYSCAVDVEVYVLM